MSAIGALIILGGFFLVLACSAIVDHALGRGKSDNDDPEWPID